MWLLHSHISSNTKLDRHITLNESRKKKETADYFFPPQVEDILLKNVRIFQNFKATISRLSVKTCKAVRLGKCQIILLTHFLNRHSWTLVSYFDWKNYKRLISYKLRWNMAHITASSHCNLQSTKKWWIVCAANCWTPITFDLCLPTLCCGWRKTLTFIFSPRFLFPEYTKTQLSRWSISSHTGVNYCTFEPYNIHYREHYFCEFAA